MYQRLRWWVMFQLKENAEMRDQSYNVRIVVRDGKPYLGFARRFKKTGIAVGGILGEGTPTGIWVESNRRMLAKKMSIDLLN